MLRDLYIVIIQGGSSLTSTTVEQPPFHASRQQLPVAYPLQDDAPTLCQPQLVIGELAPLLPQWGPQNA